MKLVISFLLTCSAFAADMDSTRGALLFESQGCIHCHSVNGQGGKTAPDLGRVVDRSFTPAALASAMWNHAPAMWSAMRAARPVLDEQSSGDLFAYFYAARFFEQPGDAGRGKRVFAERRCAGCHGLGAAASSHGLPPSGWSSLDDPVALAAAMWNHAPQMRAELSSGGIHWPARTGQDLADLLIYVRNSPEKRNAAVRFQISNGTEGEGLFRSKGCAACHGPVKLLLPERLRGLTLTGIAAQMWNHAPRMNAQPIRLEAGEMRDLLGYLWARPFFEDGGSASGGRRVFAAKHCVACHDDTLRKGGFNGITMVSALWKHGPSMLDRMNAKGIAWPHLSGREMSNLIAYLSSGDRK